MKIVFVTREGRRLAGARVRCYHFARELRRRGVEARVLSFADALGAKDGMREHEMGAWEKMRLNMAALRVLSRSRDAVFYIHRFNYHAAAPVLASFAGRRPFILDLDDWEMKEVLRPGRFFGTNSKAHDITKYLARRALFCVAASRSLETFLSGLNRNVHYIPTGVDTDRFSPVAPGPCAGVRFSWTGTFDHQDHVDSIRFAVEAFMAWARSREDAFLEIRGAGLYGDRVADVVSRAGCDRVILRPWISHARMPAYLATIDVGLLPVSRPTRFNLSKSPTKLFEYMAMAKPVVASAAGEACRILRDRATGILADGVDGFARGMERLADDASLRRRLGDAARADAVSGYSLKVLGEKLARIVASEAA